MALAGSAALLTYSILLSAFLCLTTTPPEATVAALRWLLSPLRLLRIDVDEVALLVLLSLRFLSLVRRGGDREQAGAVGSLECLSFPAATVHCDLTAAPFPRALQVFEEIRNLALGVAVRGVDWKARAHSINVVVSNLRAFNNAQLSVLLRRLQALGGIGQVATIAGLVSQLFKNFFINASQIAGAMEAREIEMKSVLRAGLI